MEKKLQAEAEARRLKEEARLKAEEEKRVAEELKRLHEESVSIGVHERFVNLTILIANSPKLKSARPL